MDEQTRQKLEAVITERLKDRTHSGEAAWWTLMVFLSIDDKLGALLEVLTEEVRAKRSRAA
jgi:hypothetical protein